VRVSLFSEGVGAYCERSHLGINSSAARWTLEELLTERPLVVVMEVRRRVL